VGGQGGGNTNCPPPSSLRRMCPALLAASFRGAFTPRSGLSAHFSTNDLSHVLSTGALNTLPVHMGWDLAYQTAYCITPGACTNLLYAAQRVVHSCVSGGDLHCGSMLYGPHPQRVRVEDGHLAGSVPHRVHRKGRGTRNSSEIHPVPLSCAWHVPCGTSVQSAPGQPLARVECTTTGPSPEYCRN